jgi:hypothetical protein
VAKYAGAATAWVSLQRINGDLHVEVGDDGCGGADPAAGTGLQGLRDRVAAVDGALSIESPQGGGTYGPGFPSLNDGLTDAPAARGCEHVGSGRSRQSACSPGRPASTT